MKTVTELSREYAIPTATLRRWIANGLLPARRRRSGELQVKSDDLMTCVAFWNYLTADLGRRGISRLA